VGYIQPHGLVKREELLEELLRHGHFSSLPDAMAKGDRGLRRLSHDRGAGRGSLSAVL
jgi:hypothetical protein